MSQEVDFLILGQGLAGSLMAWELIARGQRVRVVDREEEATSSKVAGGLVSPISGGQLALTWRVDEWLPVAVQRYRDIEAAMGGAVRFYHEVPVVRFFRDEKERGQYEKRCVDQAYARYVSAAPDELSYEPAIFAPSHGGVEIAQGGFLEVREFLAAVRAWLVEKDAYQVAEFRESGLEKEESAGMRWAGDVTIAKGIIYCQGWEVCQGGGPFSWVPITPNKGELLTLESKDLPVDRIYNGGMWVSPRSDGRFRAGATYGRDTDPPGPTEAGREQIEAGLRRWCRASYQVCGKEAAFRPVVRGRKPVLGTHPEDPRFAILNGLGSKGVLYGPALAAMLADHLLRGEAIDPEVDVRRFWK